MTQNQINYAKLNEERRHNLATEGYTGLELSESERHNKASEGINWYSASESGRHNQAQEGINWYSAQNLADLQYFQGQQAQSQSYLNDVRGIVENANYALEKWYREQQIDVNRADAATRRMDAETRARAQSVAEREVDASIDNLLRRLGMDEDKFGLVKAQIVSEIVKNYASSGKNVSDVAKAILNLFTLPF